MCDRTHIIRELSELRIRAMEAQHCAASLYRRLFAFHAEFLVPTIQEQQEMSSLAFRIDAYLDRLYLDMYDLIFVIEITMWREGILFRTLLDASVQTDRATCDASTQTD